MSRVCAGSAPIRGNWAVASVGEIPVVALLDHATVVAELDQGHARECRVRPVAAAQDGPILDRSAACAQDRLAESGVSTSRSSSSANAQRA